MLTITSNDIFTTKNKTSDKCHLAKRLVMVSHLFGVSFYMENLIGHKFAKLTVVSFSHTYRNCLFFNCLCDCGNTKKARRAYLKRGLTRSCGCLRTEWLNSPLNRKHGLSKTKAYTVWISMKSRCYNKGEKFYYLYGGRGIKVCDRWLHSFENFYADMGEKPTPSHSIDRIDNNGNYSPENCRWATKKQQSNNTRYTRHVTFNGTTKNVSEWARVLGITRSMFNYRLNAGWDLDTIFSAPSSRTTRHKKKGEIFKKKL